MLDEKWFITEITKVEIKEVEGSGALKAYITVYYGRVAIRGFRVYKKLKEDGSESTWVKAPCFNYKGYSEVIRLGKNSHEIWKEWMEHLRDRYLRWSNGEVEYDEQELNY